MRIIAGTLGGRIFKAPHGHRTHPMGDRVKGGLFSTLGDISGLTIFDPYAGSGALSFEAVSRGAASALMLDSDRAASEVIRQNCKDLGLTGKTTVIHMTIQAWFDGHTDELFDVVLADPPYDHLQVPVIQRLASHVKQSGVFVLSWPGKEQLPQIDGFKTVKVNSYGDAQIGFFKWSQT